jgi:ATP-dependent Clp protease ATP-binding subunit ClpC
VGYEDSGALTKAVRRRPYSVVLLDEIEKAHPDVFNILLQILEEGHLIDAQGRKVDFRNAIIIMTSNLGARDIVKGQSLGFAAEEAKGLSYDALKERVTGELKKMFKPEFLNRVDEVIVFHDLTGDEIKAIVDLMVSRLREQLYAQGMSIALTEEARDLLSEQGFDPALGARPLRRAIQRMLEDPLSEQMLAGQWEPGDVIEVYLDDDGAPAFRKGEGTVAVPVAADEDEAPKPTLPPRAPSSGGEGAVDGTARE